MQLRRPHLYNKDRPSGTAPEWVRPTTAMDGGIEKTAQQRRPEAVDPSTQESSNSRGKLRYAALDEGLAFFNEDGTRHQFASPEEEKDIQKAVANHMATGEQTPGFPELDLAMLGPDGQPQIVPVDVQSSPTTPDQQLPQQPQEAAPARPGSGDEHVDDPDADDAAIHDFQRGARGGDRIVPPNPDQQQAAPEAEQTPPEPVRDLRRFRVVMSAARARGGAAGAEPIFREYVQEDGTVETNPDGTPRRFTQDEFEAISAQEQTPNPLREALNATGSPHIPNNMPPVQPLTGVPQLNQFRVLPNFVKPNLSRLGLTQQSQFREEPPAMAAILADKKSQENFYKLVEKMGRTDLVGKHARSMEDPDAMSDADQQALKGLRYEFQRRSLLANEMRAGITDNDMLFMLQENPAFNFLTNNVTPARAGEIVKQHIDGIFMGAEEDELSRMVYSQRALLDIRQSKQYRGLDERTKARLGNNASIENVNWDAVDTRTVSRILRPGIFSWGQSTIRSRQTGEAVEANLNAVMRVLGASVSRNKELRKSLVREAITAESVPDVGAVGIATYQDVVRERTVATKALDLPALRASVPAFKQRVGNRWDQLSPAERKEEFLGGVRQQEAQRNAPRSWFGAMLAAIFNALISRAEQDPQLDAAFA